MWLAIARAFVAKPDGMFVSPNIIFVCLVVILGLVNAGLWLIGAGLEISYLLYMVAGKQRASGPDKVDRAMSGALTLIREKLDPTAQSRMDRLDQRLSLTADLFAEAEQARELQGVRRIFMRLLLAKLRDPEKADPIESQLAFVEERVDSILEDAALRHDLKTVASEIVAMKNRLAAASQNADLLSSTEDLGF